jgi:hypothetical protein
LRSSIGEIFDLVFKPVLDIQDQARLTAAKKKIEEEKKRKKQKGKKIKIRQQAHLLQMKKNTTPVWKSTSGGSMGMMITMSWKTSV